MAGTTLANCWQYARWVYTIARNMRITEPEGLELIAVKVFLMFIWNPVAGIGTRPWLATTYNKRAVTATTNYVCDISVQPTHVLVELLAAVGKDLDENPLTDAEKVAVDVLMLSTGNRRYGTDPYYGGLGGSKVDLPQ